MMINKDARLDGSLRSQYDDIDWKKTKQTLLCPNLGVSETVVRPPRHHYQNIGEDGKMKKCRVPRNKKRKKQLLKITHDEIILLLLQAHD